MKTATDIKKTCLSVVGISSLLFLSSPANALCLKNCGEMRTTRTLKAVQSSEAQTPPSLNYQENRVNSPNIENRENSHNNSDMKNSIGGDMNVRVGHEHIEIGGIEGEGNFIDASVHSTIVMGDAK